MSGLTDTVQRLLDRADRQCGEDGTDYATTLTAGQVAELLALARRADEDLARLRAACRLVLGDVGDGGPSSDCVSCYTVGQVREALDAVQRLKNG